MQTRPATLDEAHELFEPLVQKYAARQGLRPALVRAAIQVESGFNPGETSPKGAMGLMQLMPATAPVCWACAAPLTRPKTFRAARPICASCWTITAATRHSPLAAYNAGLGAVDR